MGHDLGLLVEHPQHGILPLLLLPLADRALLPLPAGTYDVLLVLLVTPRRRRRGIRGHGISRPHACTYRFWLKVYYSWVQVGSLDWGGWHHRMDAVAMCVWGAFCMGTVLCRTVLYCTVLCHASPANDWARDGTTCTEMLPVSVAAGDL